MRLLALTLLACSSPDPTPEPGVAPAEDCANGADDDLDGAVDCADSDCAAAWCDEACDDGRDNDADHLVDCADPDCDGACPEVCDDGRDNDGDTATDCGDPDCLAVCDADGDGVVGLAGGGTDCDDGDPSVHPGLTEVCDGVDNDCDGLADDDDPEVDLATGIDFYPDEDGDGFGETVHGQRACAGPSGWVTAGDDCAPALPLVHPAAGEVCSDWDDDCNGLANDDDPGIDPTTQRSWYADNDGDGFGDPSDVILSCATFVIGRVEDAADCDDGDPALGPPPGWLLDGDGDGFAPAGQAAQASCTAPGSDWVSDGLEPDCDDSDAAVHPFAADPCGDGQDADCDGDDTCWPRLQGVLGAGDSQARFTASQASFPVVTGVAAGDLDGDGRADAAIAAPSMTAPGPDTVGVVYVLSGPVLGEHDASTAAALLVGDQGGSAGDTLASAGDVDGDGYDDLWVGAQSAGPTVVEGVAYLVHGPVQGTVPLSTAATTYTGVVPGERATDTLAVGQLDGVGALDVAIGAFRCDRFSTDQGCIYLVTAPQAGDHSLVNADTTLHGELFTYAGSTLAVLDLDGDGVDDVATGTNQDYGWVVRGPFLGGDLMLDQIGMRLTTTEELTHLADGGDIDGDGRDDLLATLSPTRVGTGNEWHEVELAVLTALPDSGAFDVVDGAAWLRGGVHSRVDVANPAVGLDHDGDGFSDIAVSAGKSSDPGATWLVDGPVVGLVDLDSAARFRVEGSAGDGLGETLGVAGDLDADGYPDLWIGSYSNRAWLFYGAP